MSEHLSIIETTYQKAIDKVGIENLADQFFTRFFDTFPETMKFFENTDTAYFGPKKLHIIYEFLVDIIKHPNYAEGQITQEVIRHQAYGLTDKEYYCSLIDSLHISVREALKGQWSDADDSAWNDVTLAFKGHVSASVDGYI